MNTSHNKEIYILDVIDNNKKTYTPTGYGRKLHTGKSIIALYDNKVITRCLYTCIFSNNGTSFIVLDGNEYAIEREITEYECIKNELNIEHLDTCLDCYFTPSSKYYFHLPLNKKTTNYMDLLIYGLLSLDWIDMCIGYESNLKYTYHGLRVAFYDCFKDVRLSDVFISLDDPIKDTDIETVSVYFSLDITV